MGENHKTAEAMDKMLGQLIELSMKLAVAKNESPVNLKTGGKFLNKAAVNSSRKSPPPFRGCTCTSA
ncbi:MAG: hypothetical protein WDN00_10300 [Limisphaerales bacterium]